VTDSAVRFDAVIPPEIEGWPGPISFEVQRGSMVQVSTRQAAATMVVRLLVGSRAPASGRVSALGLEPSRLNRWQAGRFRRRLGVAFHKPSGLVSNLDLEMNLVVPQIYSGLRGPGPAHRASRELMDQLDLTDWRSLRPADLPPRIRREAALARALVRDPELLLLEEPTDGLDSERADRVLGLCREHAKTIVITSADGDQSVFRAVDQMIAIDADSHEMGNV
jgi:ABC-type multidrug transport system ATPase subunit